MILLGTVLATFVSTLAIWLSSMRDAKRRRVAGLQQLEKRPAISWLLLAVSIVPGPVLIAMGNLSGFICWIAAVTVTGWLVAVRRPSAG